MSNITAPPSPPPSANGAAMTTFWNLQAESRPAVRFAAGGSFVLIHMSIAQSYQKDACMSNDVRSRWIRRKFLQESLCFRSRKESARVATLRMSMLIEHTRQSGAFNRKQTTNTIPSRIPEHPNLSLHPGPEPWSMNQESKASTPTLEA